MRYRRKLRCRQIALPQARLRCRQIALPAQCVTAEVALPLKSNKLSAVAHWGYTHNFV
jgi:hypothetical protein